MEQAAAVLISNELGDAASFRKLSSRAVGVADFSSTLAERCCQTVDNIVLPPMPRLVPRDYDGRTENGELTEEHAVESLVFMFENMSDRLSKVYCRRRQ